MIRFRKWPEHNKSAIKDIIRTRVKRGVRVDAPVAMTKVLLVVKFDANFERFADTVGGEMAESYFLRAIQYAADRDGFLGSIRVPRDRFGAVVLSRQWHQCSRVSGEKVYDALLSSCICVSCTDAEFEAELRQVIAVMSADKSGNTSGIVSAPLTPSPSLPPSPTPPPLATRAQTTGGSSASPLGTAAANGTAPDAPSPELLASANAVCAVIVAKSSKVSQDVREAGKRMRVDIANGRVTEDDLLRFLRTAYADTDCRIAALRPPESVGKR